MSAPYQKNIGMARDFRGKFSSSLQENKYMIRSQQIVVNPPKIVVP